MATSIRRERFHVNYHIHINIILIRHFRMFSCRMQKAMWKATAFSNFRAVYCLIVSISKTSSVRFVRKSSFLPGEVKTSHDLRLVGVTCVLAEPRICLVLMQIRAAAVRLQQLNKSPLANPRRVRVSPAMTRRSFVVARWIIVVQIAISDSKNKIVTQANSRRSV